MAGVLVVVVSIAAVDSLNPSTLLPAAVLALGERPLRPVALFAAGVFTMSTLGGIALLFVGRTIVARIAHPSAHTRHLAELVIGIALVVAGVVLWTLRHHVGRQLRGASSRGSDGSSFGLGAGIMGVELPTAFPYFAAILATLEGVHGAALQTLVVVVYNLVFVAPLLAILILVAVAGQRGARLLAKPSQLVQRWAPIVVPIGLASIGVVLIALGAVGL